MTLFFWSLAPLRALSAHDKSRFFLRRLHSKYEAAGKVRIFAMVDWFTQWLCTPLHEYLFKVVKKFPTDGTHNQNAVLRGFQEKGIMKVWSFDLKSATDRIPIRLYSPLLSHLMGYERFCIWKRLLVGLPYHCPETSTFEYYGTGQPMGALSSWASLDLLHHCIVQYAAFRAGIWSHRPDPSGLRFVDYAIVGDDVVIGHEGVALQYKLICSEFGIPIGLAKSIVSRLGVFEFIKQFATPSYNFSPASLTESISVKSWSSRFVQALRLMRTWSPTLRFDEWFRNVSAYITDNPLYAHKIMGFIYKGLIPSNIMALVSLAVLLGEAPGVTAPIAVL